MGKNSKNSKNSNKTVSFDDKLPYVSVCTPTFNRRPFIPIMFECFNNQTYPKSKMEWIIVDDGTDKIEDLVKSCGISNIKYVSLPKKITLGEKRNIMHKHAKGSIIVYMDDDDYYPPERVEHAVQKLLDNPTALCAGSSEMYIYFKHIDKMYQSGPFGPNHATAATFAFRSELLKQTQYEDAAALAEERAFLKEYTIPFVQLDPMKTILVFSHNHNSFDKKKLLEYGESPVLKQSDKTVDMFIREPFETSIKNFFMRDIELLLKNYAPGDPINKPDVIIQTAEIEKKRKEMNDESGYIMLQQPGKEPVKLALPDIVNILQQQQTHIQNLTDTLQKLENRNKDLEEQLRLMEMLVSVSGGKKEDISVRMSPKNKSDPEVYVSI
jgi:glycosyltransferase involved in cell wall biosynthesis